MLNVLIIGGGNIAGGFDAARPAGSLPVTHAGAYRRHGGFVVSACVEPDAGRRAAFTQRWEIPRGFACVGEAVSEGARFDVVSICSPTVEHHQHLLACPELGARLVFCEKPMCATVAQAEHALGHLRERDIRVALNHNRRWDPAVAALRAELRQGVWGQLRSVTGHYNKGVLNNGSHLLDLIECLVGPLRLLHSGPASHDFWDADPSVPAMLVGPGNIPVTLNCGHAADYSLFELQLVLESAVVAMEDGGLRWRVRPSAPSAEFAGYTALTAGEVRPGRYLESMSLAVQNIHQALTAGVPLESTGDTALAAQRLCEQIKALAMSPNSSRGSRSEQ